MSIRGGKSQGYGKRVITPLRKKILYNNWKPRSKPDAVWAKILRDILNTRSVQLGPQQGRENTKYLRDNIKYYGVTNRIKQNLERITGTGYRSKWQYGWKK